MFNKMYLSKLFLIFLVLIFLNGVFCDVFPGNRHDPKPEGRSLTGGKKGHDDGVEEPESCKSTEQSPVNLDESYIKKGRNVLAMHFGVGYKTVRKYCIINKGHTVELHFKKNDGLTVSGLAIGGKDVYKFQQLHFHWGKDENTYGSEHAINGQEYAGEIHLVHIRDKYTDIHHALNQTKDRNAILVIGIMMEDKSTKPNLGFHKISKSLVCMSNTKENDTMSHLLYGKMALKSLLPHISGNQPLEVFRYQGSLTTGDCNELVRWIVFKHPIKVTNKQMDALRNVHTAEGVELDNASENVRVHKPVNHRRIDQTKVQLRF